jgi:hypothetical protein
MCHFVKRILVYIAENVSVGKGVPSFSLARQLQTTVSL